MGWGGGGAGDTCGARVLKVGPPRGHESQEPLLSVQKTKKTRTIQMCLDFGF